MAVKTHVSVCSENYQEGKENFIGSGLVERENLVKKEFKNLGLRVLFNFCTFFLCER